MKILITLFSIVSFGVSPLVGVELTLRSDMTLNDLYEQGIYPSTDGHYKVIFVADPIVLSLEGIPDLIRLPGALGTMSFSIRQEIKSAWILANDPVPVAEGVRMVEEAAKRLGVEPRYGRWPPTLPPGADPSHFTSISAIYWVPDSPWIFTITGKKSEGLLFINMFFERKTTRREDTIRMKEMRFAPMMKEPEKWSHLPLKGSYRGIHPEVIKFTFLVSSYDDEGRLLPEFQKKRDELEGKKLKSSSRRGRAGPTNTPSGETTTEPKVSHWIWAALSFVVALLGYWWYRKRAYR